ncbi:Hypothetical predicted protein [Pelobates cultripes]|uniref:Uncharacterized protein n=1 Tax=Pelobates cultripes TaxID=61616 RepID=A0AAD1RWI2_PELCU|nr:Hypothetical predicted protein [Pelobates cultripes]
MEADEVWVKQIITGKTRLWDKWQHSHSGNDGITLSHSQDGSTHTPEMTASRLAIHKMAAHTPEITASRLLSQSQDGETWPSSRRMTNCPLSSRKMAAFPHPSANQRDP